MFFFYQFTDHSLFPQGFSLSLSSQEWVHFPKVHTDGKYDGHMRIGIVDVCYSYGLEIPGKTKLIRILTNPYQATAVGLAERFNLISDLQSI